MVTQVEIARRVGLDVSSVNKILNRRTGPVFRKATIRPGRCARQKTQGGRLQTQSQAENLAVHLAVAMADLRPGALAPQ